MVLLSLRPRSQRLCVALMLYAGLCGLSLAQQVQPPASGRPASASVKPAPGGPAWTELNADQRRSLAPLASSWPQISEPQKRKWIAMAGNFNKMSPAEQAKLHSRMTEWAALSPQQRAQARLNFGETQQVSAEEKKANWEAYQALPPEEKRKLADGVERKPPTTAAAVKPVAPQKLATLPRAPSDEGVKPPRIVAVPPGESVEPTN